MGGSSRYTGASRSFAKAYPRRRDFSYRFLVTLLAEMELMCDRVAIIQNGKLVDVRLIKEFVHEDGKQRVVFRGGCRLNKP